MSGKLFHIHVSAPPKNIDRFNSNGSHDGFLSFLRFLALAYSTKAEHPGCVLAASQAKCGEGMLVRKLQVNVVSQQLREHLARRHPIGMTGEDTGLRLEPIFQSLQAGKHGMRRLSVGAYATSFRK